MKKINQILSYVLVALLAGTATFAFVTRSMPENYTKLEQLSDLIGERFIGEADPTAMQDAAADAMVRSLGDRWSYYIPAAEYGSYQEQMDNAYVGVGITIQLREDGYLDVVQVTPGGPAEAAGMVPGDILRQVDGRDVAELGINETRNLVRGEENTAVDLTVLRSGTEQTIEVVRAYFETPVVESEMLEDGIGYIRILNFDGRCAEETIAAVEQLRADGAGALLFDVRNNPGGYKDELVKILDYLLPEGPLFRSESYDGSSHVDESGPECVDLPMAVLVNSESYSAAEFFAAALREYEAGPVIGEKTVGKGYFQQTYKLLDGSAVGLSVGKYSTPKGINLAGVGIEPDVTVEVDDGMFAQIYYGTLNPAEDPQIQAAIDTLKTGNNLD